jgi:hypothetical protein
VRFSKFCFDKKYRLNTTLLARAATTSKSLSNDNSSTTQLLLKQLQRLLSRLIDQKAPAEGSRLVVELRGGGLVVELRGGGVEAVLRWRKFESDMIQYGVAPFGNFEQ